MLLFDPRATRLLQRLALLALVELPPFSPLHLLLVDLDAVSARDTDGDALRYGIVFGDRERFVEPRSRRRSRRSSFWIAQVATEARR